MCSKNKNTTAINDAIQKLAAESGCNYVSISDVLLNDIPELKAFNIIKTYLRDYPINFTEAMMLQSS